MKSSRLLSLALLAGTLVATALLAVPFASALSPPKWKVGDRVEAYDTYTSTWEKATIFLVEDYRSSGSKLYYKAKLDKIPKGSTQDELLLTEQQIRPLNAPSKAFRVGAQVDVYYQNGQGKNRGTIIAVGADRRYKVHYAGCTAKWDEWVDRLAVKAPARISRGNAAVRFLVGKWLMFTPSYPNTIIHNDQILREYGTGAKSPPLQINANGTYVWHFDFDKSPVKGRWTPDAKVPGADTGTQSQDGVLIHDPNGRPWKAYRWRVKNDHVDRISAQQMCSGVSDIGTRL